MTIPQLIDALDYVEERLGPIRQLAHRAHKLVRSGSVAESQPVLRELLAALDRSALEIRELRPAVARSVLHFSGQVLGEAGARRFRDSLTVAAGEGPATTLESFAQGAQLSIQEAAELRAFLETDASHEQPLAQADEPIVFSFDGSSSLRTTEDLAKHAVAMHHFLLQAYRLAGVDASNVAIRRIEPGSDLIETIVANPLAVGLILEFVKMTAGWALKRRQRAASVADMAGKELAGYREAAAALEAAGRADESKRMREFAAERAATLLPNDTSETQAEQLTRALGWLTDFMAGGGRILGGIGTSPATKRLLLESAVALTEEEEGPARPQDLLTAQAGEDGLFSATSDEPAGGGSRAAEDE